MNKIQEFEKLHDELIILSSNGDLDKLKILLPQLVLMRDDLDSSARTLLEAARNNHLHVVQYLLENNVDIHDNNDQALIDACTHNHIDLAQFLLDNGANPHAQNYASLLNASRLGNLDAIKLLVKYGGNISINNGLIEASTYGHFDVVKYFLEQGADSHAQEKAFMQSCINGRTSLVIYFMENGLNHGDNEQIALYQSARYGYLNIFTYLAGQDTINLENYLKISACYGALNITQFLILERDHDPYIALNESKIHKQLHVSEWCETYIKSNVLKNKLNHSLLKSNTDIKKKKI